MEFEELKNNNFWRIDTWDYSTGYKKYFHENKIVMGLGSDLDLIKYIGSKKKVTHKNKSYIENFLEIKKGDYVEWVLYDRINKYEEDYLEVNKLLGKVTEEPSQGYEFIKDVGHAMPIQLIENGANKLIIDTKWKAVKYDGKVSCTTEDIYQMYAYATTYREVNRVILLYPCLTVGNGYLTWELTSYKDKLIEVRTIRLDKYTNTMDDLKNIILFKES